jgi:hypothetical protein
MMNHLYGEKLVDGKTVTLDHAVQEFTVVIRSCSGIHPQTLKDLIERKFEVVSIKAGESKEYVS